MCSCDTTSPVGSSIQSKLATRYLGKKAADSGLGMCVGYVLLLMGYVVASQRVTSVTWFQLESFKPNI